MRYRAEDGWSPWSASRASARPALPWSWRPTLVSARPKCSGAAAMRGKARRPTGPGCRPSAPTCGDVDPEQLRSEMGAGAADIAEVVSDVREQLPGLDVPPQLEPEQARFRLFDSITAFLKSAGQRKPLVLVLDDLHWADHPSLLLLEFVARELASARVLIIGTYRDMELSRQHPLSATLGELTRERLFQRVLLRGLDQEEKHVRTDLESDNAANTLRLGSQQVRSFAEHSFGDIGSWARVVTGQPNAF